jgi:hypothetical protein
VRPQTIVFHDLLKLIPWAVLDRTVEETRADDDPRRIKTRAHVTAMLHAQLSCGREVEANLKSHASKLPQLGGSTISKSALSDANAKRPYEIFTRMLSALMLSLAGRLSPQNRRLRAAD